MKPAEVRPGNAQITANTVVAAERRYDAVEIIPFDPDGFSSAGCPRTAARLHGFFAWVSQWCFHGQPVLPLAVHFGVQIAPPQVFCFHWGPTSQPCLSPSIATFPPSSTALSLVAKVWRNSQSVKYGKPAFFGVAAQTFRRLVICGYALHKRKATAPDSPPSSGFFARPPM
ncbi:MAG: hypothetical protein WBL61_14010 [Bryobacteraceae bacterium]